MNTLSKIPCVRGVGGREAESETVPVRSRDGGGSGFMTLDKVTALTKDARETGTAAMIA